MKFCDVLKDLEYEVLQGDINCEISDIVYDSRKAVPQGVFVCMVGANVDGHTFINQVIENGVTAIIVEREVENVPQSVAVVKVKNTRYALACVSAAYFGYPAKQFVSIGVTGTKGKTTTTYMIKSVLETAGNKVGLIGTTGILIGDEKIATKNTTPESYELQKAFRKMVDSGCKYMVMEVSSQGLMQNRVAGIEFDYGIFTNFSADHIGPTEHASLEEYAACKSLLFRQSKIAIANNDDAHKDEILKGHTCEKVVTFGINNSVDLKAKNCEFLKDNGMIGMRFDTEGAVDYGFTVYTPGMFSVYNALVTVCLCNLLGIKNEDIAIGLTKAMVKGRVELVPCSKDFSVIIDYAHNELSTTSVLTALAEYKPNRIICVFGSGGNRSKIRRYDVGEAAGKMADLCILTSDNPRTEAVADINSDIKVGLAKTNCEYVEIEDRTEAIKYAIEHAQKGDFVVLLGKGHETYQEINGVRYHFDEREAVAKAREELNLV